MNLPWAFHLCKFLNILNTICKYYDLEELMKSYFFHNDVDSTAKNIEIQV